MYKENLDADYSLKKSIDMKENKRDFYVLNGVSLFIAVVLFVPYLMLNFMQAMALWHYLVLLVLFVVNIIVHEWIHAIGFKYKTKVKVTYQFHGFAASASVPGGYFKKHHYLRSCLLPFIVLSIVYAAFIPLGGAVQAMALFMLINHIASCAGDYYVALVLFKMPKDTYIRDYGVGMELYTKS